MFDRHSRTLVTKSKSVNCDVLLALVMLKTLGSIAFQSVLILTQTALFICTTC